MRVRGGSLRLFGLELSRRARRPHHLAAAATHQLDVVHERAVRDHRERHCVPRRERHLDARGARAHTGFAQGDRSVRAHSE
eukprot:1777430-Prymnesium_polylepis.1